jgi:hypothetical protein
VTSSPDRRRSAPNPWDVGFGAVTLAGSLAALLFWFPHDIKGGFIETSLAGRLQPGDAFFPVLLASALLSLSVVQLFSVALTRTRQESDTAIGKLTPANLKFLFLFYAIVLTGLTVMYWLGPVTTALLKDMGIIDQSYRQLLDTPPYKYLGYIGGGFLMTAGLITWAEGKVRPHAILTVVIVLFLSVLIFGILLKNIQLPPNADF